MPSTYGWMNEETINREDKIQVIVRPVAEKLNLSSVVCQWENDPWGGNIYIEKKETIIQERRWME